ncbi:unnamed protein product [Adineta ricciae]|uniref:LRRCT domain-containing protein n=1 Tax=Adineta ricciae TaxID=249248 RepID=A0A815Z979_ADIRI|nr:unnamed protein product [Adineta ricciae]
MMFLLLYFLLLIPSIQTCPLKTVDIRSGCYCGIEIDGMNYIQCHPYTISKIPEFTRSYVHDKLNLSNNLIEHLTNKSFYQLKVKRIYLENNPINSIDKQTFNQNNLLHYLEELHIDSFNESIEFLCYGTWKNLRILKLSGFNLNQFQFCFDKLTRLEKLVIQHSHINIISHHIYSLPFLHELSITHDSIQYLNFDEHYLTHSSSIRVLNLTSNQLRSIPNDVNLRLPHLVTLDLSHNLIEQIPSINQMTTLNVNLSFNLISYVQLNLYQHLTLDLSTNPICTMDKSTDVSNIILHNLTHMHCDCRLGFILNENLTRFIGNETKCLTPAKFQGLYVQDLTYEQLMGTCSSVLPKYCKEIRNFAEIQDFASSFTETTPFVEVTEKLTTEQVSSIRLVSFHTHYENNDLLIFWDFDVSSSTKDVLTAQFQIIIEQDSEVIRRSQFISPYLKQYIIPHLPANKNYYVCLILTRTFYGTDKYCRQANTSTSQTFSQMLLANRSIIFGFLTGTILTACLLVTLAFICHLQYKRKHSLTLFPTHRQQTHYMYINRNEDDGTYSHSIVSSPSPKYSRMKKSHSRRTYLAPVPPWYQHDSKHLSTAARSPCCFSQYHNRTLSDCTTTNRMPSVSSEYSNGIDKEQMTSTSIMSNMSSDEQHSNIIQSPAKHVYEELGDDSLLL